MSLFRIRYNGIKQGSSYANFEKDILTAHMNGVQTEEINNSSVFGRELTKQVEKVMRVKIEENI